MPMETGGLNTKSSKDWDEFIAAPSSVTAQGAGQFGVAAEIFADWRWQMSHQFRQSSDADGKLALHEREQEGFKALEKIFHAGVTPYYAALMQKDPQVSCPIRLQGMPRTEELSDPIGRWDPLEEKGHSPVREVVHVYPDRVAFCVAELCPVYCRYCFRKRRDNEDGLHFNRAIMDRGIAYIASNPAIRDVLVTGGDPFIASDKTILNLTERLRAIPHVEIIRFGTRTPVTLPYRITSELTAGLARFHPIFVNTHFNCPEELTPEAVRAVEILVNHGIPVGNQSVLLKGVNDSYEKMLMLLRGLLRARVRPYYLFHPHLVAGTDHLRPTVQVGLDIMRRLRGQITGLGLPTYIIDTPAGKVPLTRNHILGEDGKDLILEDPRGEIWREVGVLS